MNKKYLIMLLLPWTILLFPGCPDAGYDKPNLEDGMEDDWIGKIDPVPYEKWQKKTWQPQESPRAWHSAVWTGSRLMIWGGEGDSGFLQTGTITDLIYDYFQYPSPVQNSGSPSARAGHSAVWSGSEVIVWGGGDFIATDSGGRYNPSSDSWSATSNTGAPSGRWLNSCIWTGTRMLVWGGVSSIPLGNGASYDPFTDTWSPISGASAPEPRYYHSTIWTGTRMIVWGGKGQSGAFLNSGFAYDPATDVWTSIAGTGSPSARAEHGAVWTGTSMIVFGGNDSSDTTLNDGGIWNQSTDTWVTLPLSGAPSPRCDASVVWDGYKRMIVWGGSSSSSDKDSNCLGDGALYLVQTGEWKAMPSLNAPSARHGHSTILLSPGRSNDGSAIDIALFGGRNYTGFLNDFEIFHIEDPYP